MGAGELCDNLVPDLGRRSIDNLRPLCRMAECGSPLEAGGAEDKEREREREKEREKERECKECRMDPDLEGLSRTQLMEDVMRLREAMKEHRRYKEEAEFQRNILKCTGQSIICTDLSGIIIYWNKAATQIYGWEESEVMGKNIFAVLPASNPMIEEEGIAIFKELSKGKQYKGEFSLFKKNGEVVDVMATNTPVMDEHGTLVGIIGCSTDIYELKRKEQEILRLNAELELRVTERTQQLEESNARLKVEIQEHLLAKENLQAYARDLEASREKILEQSSHLEKLVDELRVSRIEAESANRLKSRFLASMSHEIRTPMNGVIGMTNLILSTELTEEQQQFVHTIRTSGDSLLAIIDDILDFSKIEAGELLLEHRNFSFMNCLEDTVDLLAVKSLEKGIELICYVDSTVPELVQTDPTRFRQVLVNLLSNALKFTEVGEIIIRASAEPWFGEAPNYHDAPQTRPIHKLHVSVQDTGIGIHKGCMERLFKPFSQIDASTTRKQGGTGLGLIISKQLVEMLGGDMWVESGGPDCGSTFHFTIALYAPEYTSIRAHMQVEKLEMGQNRSVTQLPDNDVGRSAECPHIEMGNRMGRGSGGSRISRQSSLPAPFRGSKPWLLPGGIPEACGSIIETNSSTPEDKDEAQANERACDVTRQMSIDESSGSRVADGISPRDQLLALSGGNIIDSGPNQASTPNSGQYIANLIQSSQTMTSSETPLSSATEDDVEADDSYVKGEIEGDVEVDVNEGPSPENDLYFRTFGNSGEGPSNGAQWGPKRPLGKALSLPTLTARLALGNAFFNPYKPEDSSANTSNYSNSSSKRPPLGKLILHHQGESSNDVFTAKSRGNQHRTFQQMGEEPAPKRISVGRSWTPAPTQTLPSTSLSHLNLEESQNLLPNRPPSPPIEGCSTENLKLESESKTIFNVYPSVDSKLHSTQAPLRPHPISISPAVTSPSRLSPLKGKRVLLVDDNASVRRILSAHLRDVQMEPTAVEGGREALALLEERERSGSPFHIVIMDMQMPELDGLTTAKRMAELPAGKTLPVILLCPYGGVNRVNHEGTQVAAVLSKPVRQSLLNNSLLSALQETEREGGQSRSSSRRDKRERESGGGRAGDVSSGGGFRSGMGAQYPLKILLVEDNLVNQRVATRMLSRLAYTCDVAGNGQEALEAVEKGRYDLVLMDIQMPVMDGIEATHRILQRRGPEKRPRIIAMTANVLNSDRELCLGAGMDGFISKPIHVQDLISALEETSLLWQTSPER